MLHTLCLRRYLTIGLLAAPLLASASQPADSTSLSFRTADVNRIGNIQWGSQNPTRLSHNPVRESAQATVAYRWQEGSFHQVDASPHSNALCVDIEGLRSLGRFDLSGHIRYRNSTERDRRWNSTLLLSPGNPFILGDSVKSDVDTELFDLGVAAAYRLNRKWTLGMEANLVTGSSADQTDPRPKTDASRIRLMPGAEFRLSEAVAVGAALGADIYRSDITHAIINTQASHRYFLMKGLGDYMRQSSADLGSYPRDYRGETYTAALQAAFTPAGRSWSDFLELTLSSGREDAEDGGSTYTFKGGDYDHTSLALYNRLSWHRADALHGISLRMRYATGEGTWYDQKKATDPDHGNLAYYIVMGQSKIYDHTDLSAQAEYSLALMRDGLPHLELKAGAGTRFHRSSHYEAYTDRMEYTLATLYAQVSKSLTARQWLLRGTLGGSYTATLGDKTFSPFTADLTEAYTAPRFEYESAARAEALARIDASVPLPRWHIGLTLFAQAALRFYCDDATYSTLLDGTSQTAVHAGVALTF